MPARDLNVSSFISTIGKNKVRREKCEHCVEALDLLGNENIVFADSSLIEVVVLFEKCKFGDGQSPSSIAKS